MCQPAARRPEVGFTLETEEDELELPLLLDPAVLCSACAVSTLAGSFASWDRFERSETTA